MAKTLRCSFCGKSEHEVDGLVANSHGESFVCNECILACLRIVFEGTKDVRYQELVSNIQRLQHEDELNVINKDLFRLEAERENLLHDMASLQVKQQ